MFKFLEKTIEFISMVKIVLSPILFFSFVSVTCYFYFESALNIILSITSIILGLILGICWAIYIHKKHGATEFNARIYASPDTDKVQKK